MASIEFCIPEIIADKISVSKIYQNIGANGRPTSFGLDISLDELDLRKSLRSRELPALSVKLEDTLAQWSKRYEKHVEHQYKLNREQEADRLNEELIATMERLSRILRDTLDVDDRVNWERLKSYGGFSIEAKKLFDGEPPERFSHTTFFEDRGVTGLAALEYPAEPTRDIAKKCVGLLVRLFMPKKVDDKLSELKREWDAEVKTIDEARRRYENLKAEFEQAQERQNSAIDSLRARYLDGDPGAVEEHIDVVFQNSQYPDEIPRNWETEYRAGDRILVVNIELPIPEKLPTDESYKYIKSRDEIEAKPMVESKKRKIYDDVIYQIILRTMHEIFESDVTDVIDASAVNGYVDAINPATGKRELKTIASISANKDAFEEVDLSKIDPKATFKHFKGVAAARLADLAAIPPVIQMDRTDKRFIEGEDVAQYLDESVNIAAMPWQDFEYLIREIFHSEFSASGGEVQVTQASADGGVDAIAFDPDPIRGGKIVIQAKRYTNTVGVSAVRDLYGTVLNEGASSGILVTTSSYGKDAYEFAKNKPLKLLNGSNLLSLLERHGHRARIDLAEAKQLARP